MQLAGLASVAVAIILIALKTWAWSATGSIAMLSSLADSLLDLVASCVTLFAVKVAVSPADREHRFGHGKSEGIASLIQSLIISASAAYVAFSAVQRLFAPSAVESPELGVLVTICSLALTLGLATFQALVVRRTGSMAISADAAHYRADILTNLAVLVAIFASSAWGLHIVDPLLGLFVVAVILWTVREIARDSLNVLLDRELPESDRRRIAEIASAHPQVRGVHDLRTRSSGSAQFIQFHLELDPGMSLARVHEVSDAVETSLRKSFPSAEVLIHADPVGIDESRDPF
jgi:ferrous-iron efflux pump FieF